MNDDVIVSNVIKGVELISKFDDYATDEKGLSFSMIISPCNGINYSFLVDSVNIAVSDEVCCAFLVDNSGRDFNLVVGTYTPAQLVAEIDELPQFDKDRLMELDERIYSEVGFAADDNELLDWYEETFNDFSKYIDIIYTRLYNEHINNMIEEVDNKFIVSGKTFNSHSDAFKKAVKVDKIWQKLKEE